MLAQHRHLRMTLRRFKKNIPESLQPKPFFSTNIEDLKSKPVSGQCLPRFSFTGLRHAQPKTQQSWCTSFIQSIEILLCKWKPFISPESRFDPARIRSSPVELTSKLFDWRNFCKNLIAPGVIFGAALILYYIWTHTPYSLHFKHLTLSEYTLQRGHWYTIFTSSCVPIDTRTLASWIVLGVGSALHMATKFKARHFWALFVVNRWD